MITLAKATKNIHNIAKQATPSNWKQGKQWYVQANQFCHTQASLFYVPLDKVVGVLAVLSPNCAWETNKLATIDLLENRQTHRQVYPANIAKALRILDGESFETVTSHKRYGRKVRAFYDNILNTDKSESITVDTHAIRAAFNLADLTSKHLCWVFASKIGNSTISKAYIAVAQHYKLSPNQLQAVVWLATKDSLKRTV